MQLIKTWKNINIYINTDSDNIKAGQELMNTYVTKNKKEIKLNSFGKPYLVGNRIYFNISHTKDYACLAVSSKDEVGVDIERCDRQVDYRAIMLSRFNIQYLNKIGNSVEFIKEWTIREGAIKCYGDLTLNSIYGVETYKNILKCDGKPDLEYHVFRYENTFICVTRKITKKKKTKK